MLALVGALVTLFGCGARSDLTLTTSETDSSVEDAATDTPARDTTVADTSPLPACTPRWDRCRIDTGPLLVSASELGQHPDVVWADTQLIVVYDGDVGGNTVVGLSLKGDELFRETLLGTQAPRVAWNPRTHTGLVMMDTLVRWLDSDGRPSETFVRPDLGFQVKGDPAAVGDGFIVMTGANSYSSPPPLYVAHVPARPVDFLDFALLHAAAPRAAPEHATDDEGFATFSVAATWGFDTGEIWRMEGPDAPALERELGVPGAHYLNGVVEADGERLLFYGQTTGDLYLMNLDTGHTRLVANSPTGADGHLERLGETVVGAFRYGAEEGIPDRVILGRFDLEGDVVSDIHDLSEPGRTAHSTRITRTPRGLAVVWSEGTGDTDGMSARLAVFDCCP